MSTVVPDTMQAVQFDEQSGRLVIRQCPVPRPGPGQVLIRMAAAPINPSDLGYLRDPSVAKQPPPAAFGREGSGTVVAAGPGFFPRFLMGRRVACAAGLATSGTWAEYMVTTATTCFPLAKNISLEQGAMLIVNPMTAVAFFDIAKQGKHAAIVSNAAASALGRMILRLGHTFHIPVIHIVRRQAQVDLLRSLGGEHVLNNTDSDFQYKLHTLADQLKATLFLDPVGGEQVQLLLDAAPNGSTVLVYGLLSGERREPASYTYRDGKHVEGFYLPDWLTKKNILQVLLMTRRVQRLANELQTTVQKRFPLSEAQQALELYQANPTEGKVLLVI